MRRTRFRLACIRCAVMQLVVHRSTIVLLTASGRPCTAAGVALDRAPARIEAYLDSGLHLQQWRRTHRCHSSPNSQAGNFLPPPLSLTVKAVPVRPQGGRQRLLV